MLRVAGGAAYESQRSLIDGASYPPEVVKAMGQALDLAWSEIAHNFGPASTVTEVARLRLAEAILSVAAEDSTNVEALKNGALDAMSKKYRLLSTRPPKVMI